MKEPSGFDHAATVLCLKTAFCAYDVARKYPFTTSLAVVTGTLAAGGAILAAQFVGVTGALVGGLAMMQRVFNIQNMMRRSGLEDYKARDGQIEKYDRLRKVETNIINAALNSGNYWEAIKLKLASLRPLSSIARAERFYNPHC